jgi:hypothetical protein
MKIKIIESTRPQDRKPILSKSPLCRNLFYRKSIIDAKRKIGREIRQTPFDRTTFGS